MAYLWYAPEGGMSYSVKSASFGGDRIGWHDPRQGEARAPLTDLQYTNLEFTFRPSQGTLSRGPRKKKGVLTILLWREKKKEEKRDSKVSRCVRCEGAQ